MSSKCVIRIATLGVCWTLMGCQTHTQSSAVIKKISPCPAPISNFQVVSPGRTDGTGAVYRSGQPETECDWQYLEKLGIKTVVKLNEFSDKVDAETERCIAKTHHIDVITYYMQPEDWPHNLNLSAHPDEEVLLQAVETLKNNNRPVLVHCSHGKDRTGLVVAAYSVLYKNYCKNFAIKEMEHYGANPLLSELKPMLDSPKIKEGPHCINPASYK